MVSVKLFLTDTIRLLNIVEFALTQQNARNGNDQHTPNLAFIPSVSPDGAMLLRRTGRVLASERPVLEVINRLPKQFTTSDVILGLGEEGKERRNAVKFTLARAVASNHIRLIQKGQGRRPSRYEKVTAE